MENPWVPASPSTAPSRGSAGADLFSIGEFARLSGLSIGALRHYDSVGVLVPAAVDGATSYRRYRREQLETARWVAQLRELEVPLEEIREVLAADDARQRRDLLVRHRDRVRARVTRLHRVLHQLGHVIDPSDHHEENDMSDTAGPELDPATQKALASALFNRVWELLEATDRTPADDDELVNAAHASRYLWTSIGTPRHLAIGDWQIARAYSTLGRGEPAVHHARRCLDHATQVGDEPWLLASAYEGLARAYAVAGDRAAAGEWKAKAQTQIALDADPDNREIVERDIDSLPV
jgi:DNA-binding transcriptional MerR regulator